MRVHQPEIAVSGPDRQITVDITRVTLQNQRDPLLVTHPVLFAVAVHGRGGTDID